MLGKNNTQASAPERKVGEMEPSALKQLLKRKNLRFTTQRLAVLDAVCRERGRRLSAGEIFEAVKATNPGIGIATVYNTLRLLEREGVLCKAELDKTAYYGLDEGQPVRFRLVCSRCGRVREISGGEALRALMLLQGKSGFSFAEGSVELRGVCGACRREEKKPKVLG